VTRTRPILASIGKGLLAGIAWQIGLIAGAMVTPLLGFETPPVPPGVDPALIVPLGILVGVPVAIALGELSRRLQQPFLPRVLTTFTFHYLVYGLLQVLEQILFTTTVNLGYGAVSNLFPAAALALVVGVLWRPEATDRTLQQAWPRFFSARRPADWAWRLIVCWLVYLPIYRGMGLLISPPVLPFSSRSRPCRSCLLSGFPCPFA